LRSEISKILLENNYDPYNYDLDVLYESGRKYIYKHIENYYDKNYPINTVLKSLFTEGILLYLKNNGKSIVDVLVEQKTKEIKEKSDRISQRSKEINDSIKYAKSLQLSILPPLSKISEHLEDYFIFYRPKDIIGGDFYWFEKKDNYLIFSVSDCTGHGVPGGMVSLICSSALDKTINELNILDTNKILDKTSDIVVDSFNKNGQSINDGMDIILCKFDTISRKLYFSGANRPLWLIRDGVLEEFKTDKRPVGKYYDEKSFTSQVIDIKSGDILYLSSDGYGDQFGGMNDSKFKTSKFKQTLLDNSYLSIKEQCRVVEETFLNWKEDKEQTDDICIFGIKF
jgi:serine phosphatase RsbU (regulator of sigma subunit)